MTSQLQSIINNHSKNEFFVNVNIQSESYLSSDRKSPMQKNFLTEAENE